MAAAIANPNDGILVESMTPAQLLEADKLWYHEVDKAEVAEIAKLRELDRHLEELTETSNTLQTLPDKLTHDVMVPFGRVAMFPGKLVHTNEALVQLGGDTVAHVSARAARAILRRRADFVREQHTLVQQQVDALQGRKTFAATQLNEDGEEIKDIVERYDEAVHGDWSAPPVSAAVLRQREYYGPPRTAAERAEEEAVLAQLAEHVAAAQAGAAAAEEAARAAAGDADGTDGQGSTAPPAVQARGSCRPLAEPSSSQGLGSQPSTRGQSLSDPLDTGPDSDDEDEASVPAVDARARRQAERMARQLAWPRGSDSPSSGGYASSEDGRLDGEAVDEEVDRLAAIFDASMDAAADASSPESSPALHRRPLIEELPAADEAAAAADHGLDSGTAQPPSPPAARAFVAAAAKKPAVTGLRKGFYGAPKPRKLRGILKKSSLNSDGTPDSAEAPPAAPRVSPALARKTSPTQGELQAFSGEVRERGGDESAPPAATQSGATEPARPAGRIPEEAKDLVRAQCANREGYQASQAAGAPKLRVSRFKAKMMSARAD